MSKGLKAIAAVAISLTSTFAATQSADHGLLLAMKVSRGGSEMMSPTIWAPLGTTSRMSNDRGMTIEVTSASATQTAVALQFKLTEAESGKSTTHATSVEVQLGADAWIVVRKGAPDELAIQVRPRMTARPG
jgi:hypothetical protein